MRPTAIDICCGAGGMSFGLSQAGWDVVLGIDSWADALKVYRRNVRVPTLQLDIMQPDALERLPRGVDLVAGGPPCQPFSPAGPTSRGGRPAGERAEATVRFAEAVLHVSPKAFVMENVPAAFDHEVYRQAMRLLSPHYRIKAVEMDAADHGVPQRRRRLITVGMKGLDPAGLAARLATPRFARTPTVREATGMADSIPAFYMHPCFAKERPSIYSCDAPAPTILAQPYRPIPKNYVFKPGDAVRSLAGVKPLTVVEKAIVQSFPADWSWEGVPLNDAHVMIGNAVPPLLAYSIGRDLQFLPRDQQPAQLAAEPIPEDQAAVALLALRRGGESVRMPNGGAEAVAGEMVRAGLLEMVVSYRITPAGREAARASGPRLSHPHALCT